MQPKATVRINKIINGGYGLAHLPSGQVLLVQHALPGERVTVIIEVIQKNLIFGKIAEIMEAHPDRLVPPCPYYGECGGCNLQHCQYSTQLETKKSILIDLLERQHGLNLQDDLSQIPGPIASPQQFGYRQRIKLQVNSHNEFGFYRFQSHDVVAIKNCLLAAEEINHSITALKKHPLTRRLTGLAGTIEIHLNPATKKTVSIFQLKRKPRPADIKIARQLCSDIKILERIFFTGSDFPLTGPFSQDPEQTGTTLNCRYPAISGLIPPLKYAWEVSSFCQVNTRQNWNLIASVIKISDIQSTDTILDLYCGMGNFSIPLAFQAGQLLGIEGQGAAIRSAKRNAAHAGRANTLFQKGNVHEVCHRLAGKGESFDTVIIDPPREGAPGLAELLHRVTRRQLIYISCDPATLCRDLADLTGAGFHVRKIQPVDMFPQTHHLETIVCLVKLPADPII